MDIYGYLWVYMGFWVLMGACKCNWVFVGVYGRLRETVDVYGFLSVRGCLWVSMGIYRFLWVFMGYWVSMGINGCHGFL